MDTAKTNPDEQNEKHIVKKTDYRQEIAEIQDLTDLEKILTKIQEAQDAQSALTYSIKAQIKVISVLNSPKMLENPFGMMIEQLNRAIQFAENENEKKEIRQRASIMMANMAFFMEARLHYEEDRNSEKGREYLKEGCDLLAKSIVDIVPEKEDSGVAQGTKVVKAIAGAIEPSILATQLATNLFNNLAKNSDGLINKLIDWWNKGEKNAKNRAEYEYFIDSFVDKIDEHYEIFGKSIILSDFIRNKKEMLVTRRMAGFKPEEPIGSTLKGIFRPVLSVVIIAISIVLSVPLIANLNLANIPKYVVSLIPIMVAAVFLIILIRDKIAVNSERNLYKEAIEAYKKYQQNISEYYNGVYAKVSIAKNQAAENTDIKQEIEQPPFILEEYKQFRKKRYRSINENKITAGILAFPPFALFALYNFYLSYHDSNIFIFIMLVSGLLVSCGVFVWSLIDFNLFKRRIDGKLGLI